MLVKVKGLVIRTVDINESDRLITLFTEERGIVTASAKGARSLRSRMMAATQLFCYGSYVLYKKGDHMWVREAELAESFFELRNSIESLALAAYIVDIISFVGTEEAETELLRVTLNSLYAVSTGKYPLPLIKAAFEIRAMSVIGFMPDVSECSECGRSDGDFILMIMDGNIVCDECRKKANEIKEYVYEDSGTEAISAVLSDGAKTAFNYCIHCPPERLFSFRISDEDLSRFSRAAELYPLNHLERNFQTLDFYKEVTRKDAVH